MSRDLASAEGKAAPPDWYRWEGVTATPEEEWSRLAQSLPLIDPGEWQGQAVPVRQWALDGWMPHRQATYLTGPGSAGKSLLGQQLATCAALGRPLLGIETRECRTLYITCEDDAETLHERQQGICAAVGTTYQQLSGKLMLSSLVGAADTMLYAPDETGRLIATPRFRTIENVARALNIGLVVLDNTAHFFGGNENIRGEVAGFVSLLNRLAMSIDGAVLLLGHPNKAGDSFSGSTAWENQVRSRLFLETPKDADGYAPDPDVRHLSRQKANYARNGETLAFRWHAWAFVRDEDLGQDQAAEIAAVVEASTTNTRFLACLDRAISDKRAVSHSRAASNYAPRVFAKMTIGKGISPDRYENAMERLFHLGEIQAEGRVFQRENRTWATGIIRAQTPAQSPHNPPAQTRTELQHKPALNGAHIPKGILGAGALSAPPPYTTPGMILALGETGDNVTL